MRRDDPNVCNGAAPVDWEGDGCSAQIAGCGAGGRAAPLAFAGCGTPGAPMPPTLNLPDPVSRPGSRPHGQRGSAYLEDAKEKSTDKLLLRGVIPVRICRKAGSGACVPVPANLGFPPEAAGDFKEMLPQALAAGEPRTLSYFVELTQPQRPFRRAFECRSGVGRRGAAGGRQSIRKRDQGGGGSALDSRPSRRGDPVASQAAERCGPKRSRRRSKDPAGARAGTFWNKSCWWRLRRKPARPTRLIAHWTRTFALARSMNIAHSA